MSDYIKKEDAMSIIREAFSNVDICPSADVVEVRHGRWVEVKSWESEKHSVTDMRCNLCSKFASLVLPHKTKCTYKYCPNCGARMDGEEQENE